MSSKHNHMVRSHRSERRKRSALAGFRRMPKPGHNKYANYGNGSNISFGLAALRRLLARRKAEKKKGGSTDDQES